MAQNTILAAATATGTSSDVTVAAGATVTIGIYTSDAGGLPGDSRINVFIDTPSQDKFLFNLTPNDPVRVLSGPGTFRCNKPASTVAYGAFTET
jgi:hypothetical protein